MFDAVCVSLTPPSHSGSIPDTSIASLTLADPAAWVMRHRVGKEFIVMPYNVRETLNKKFIETTHIAEILELSLESKKNCIMHGPAGHGKSEMTMAALEGAGFNISDPKDCFVMSFGEGMDETKLFGGLDFKRLKDDDVLEFHPEMSFLDSKVAVFEELFDAPSIVLLALKDTLTAREMRKGAQRFPMKTQCIIALTNRSPAEISDLGPEAHALVERFPLQLEVTWDKYNNDKYHRLFTKVKPESSAFIRETLSQTCARVVDNGGFVSPRSAIHALEICEISSNGVDDENCLNNLRYIPEFANVLGSISDEIKAAAAQNQAKAMIRQLRGVHKKLLKSYNDALTPTDCIQIAKQAEALCDSVSNLKVTDDQVEKRSVLRDDISALIKNSTDRAIDLV